MSLRTSLVLLAIAFGVLTAIVAIGLRANSPEGKLQAEMERLRTSPPAPTPVSLPDLRNAPKKNDCTDQIRADCTRPSPLARPVGATR